MKEETRTTVQHNNAPFYSLAVRSSSLIASQVICVLLTCHYTLHFKPVITLF